MFIRTKFIFPGQRDKLDWVYLKSFLGQKIPAGENVLDKLSDIMGLFGRMSALEVNHGQSRIRDEKMLVRPMHLFLDKMQLVKGKTLIKSNGQNLFYF